MNMIVECQQGHRYKFGKTDDGFGLCPDCASRLKQPYQDVTGEANRLLTLAEATRKKYSIGGKPKYTIEIGADINTDKMQLKLRAIAKHAGALADELDEIDAMKECPACGSYETTTATLTDGETCKAISEIVKCSDCNHELPTRLEGSQ